MSALAFEPWPKIKRLRRDCTITEKVDGTNAQIVFGPDGDMLVGSRKREIRPNGTVMDSTPGKHGCIKYKDNTDNFGFASWAAMNKEELFEFLGEGRHYGEWYGHGIQRGYGLPDKRFALFNTGRFGPCKQTVPGYLVKSGLGVVPVLYEGAFSTDAVDKCMSDLGNNGSWLAPGTFKAEGIIVYHHGLGVYSKVTFEHDKGKWSQA